MDNRKTKIIDSYHYQFLPNAFFQRVDKNFWQLSINGIRENIHDTVLTIALNQLNNEGNRIMKNNILNTLQKKQSEAIKPKTIAIKTETKKNAILDSLGNASKGIIETETELTLEKFAAVEELKRKLIALDAKIDIYQQKQETIYKDNIEIKQFLKQLDKTVSENNSLLIQIVKRLQSIESIKTETVINRKQSPTVEPIAETKKQSVSVSANSERSELIEALYKLFMQSFNGKFCGSKKLDHLIDFGNLVDAIDFESADTIDKSIREHWTNKRSQGQFIWAAAAQSKAINAMLSAIDKIQGNSNAETVSTQTQSPVKDKAYYIEKMGIDKDTMAMIIETVKDQGNCNAETIEAIRDYCKASFAGFNEVKSFWTWIKGFIKE